MKKEQGRVNNTEMSRRGFLKRTALAGATICIAPTWEKVTAAEKALTGKSSASAASIPASMAAVRTQRTLGIGKAAFPVSAMGFGCMGLNHHRSQSPDENACIRLIHETIERGVTLFDTAESYGYHKNEKLVGEALKGYADRVFVSSKFGHKFVNG
ncbi:MAG TPA: aldo/keto reductase, partial [Parabacteroides sp.]|nr:aldo/keto reductase [Parabacteroides sp.]